MGNWVFNCYFLMLKISFCGELILFFSLKFRSKVPKFDATLYVAGTTSIESRSCKAYFLYQRENMPFGCMNLYSAVIIITKYRKCIIFHSKCFCSVSTFQLTSIKI